MVIILITSLAYVTYLKSRIEMKISTATRSSLELLTKWGDGEQIYNLYKFRDMELHGSFEECELVEEWFEDGIRDKGYDFLEFGYNRAGDPFALWVYPELTGEPPVVLLDSDGEVELLAPSLTDFLCLLTDEQSITGKIDNDKIIWYNIPNYQYKEISEENDYFKNSEEVATKVIEEIYILRSEISKIQECHSVLDIIKKFDHHPDFKKWFEENFAL